MCLRLCCVPVWWGQGRCSVVWWADHWDTQSSPPRLGSNPSLFAVTTQQVKQPESLLWAMRHRMLQNVWYGCQRMECQPRCITLRSLTLKFSALRRASMFSYVSCTSLKISGSFTSKLKVIRQLWMLFHLFVYCLWLDQLSALLFKHHD